MDSGPEFTASATCQFLKDWGVHHHLFSVVHPHSNYSAPIPCNVPYSNIASDPATKLSPAQCLFGRPIKDFIPLLPGHYIAHPTCSDTLAASEEAVRNRHMKEA